MINTFGISHLRNAEHYKYISSVCAINGYVNIPENMDTWKNIIDEMNVLVAKYDHLLATRKWRKV